MTKSTQSNRRRKPADDPRPPKPYPDFPLFAHRVGLWAKSIRGRTHYFGPWGRKRVGKWERLPGDGWQEALDLYHSQKDDLYAGRTPRPQGSEITIRDLGNRFLSHCVRKVESGEMVQRTWDDYKRVCDRIIRVLGRSQAVEGLHPDDFARLREDIGKTNGAVALTNEITRCRVVFNFAHKNLLIPQPVQYGLSFQRPSKKALRQVKAKNGPKMLEAEECRRLIEQAQTPELKAMILLALNCGFGNSDCAKLPTSAVDLRRGWISFPRPKTGIERRCPLWPETINAIEVVLQRRGEDRNLVFVTKYGHSFEKNQAAITHQFRKLLGKLGLHRKGLGFYALRRVFRTIADGCRDQPAIDHIMGHARDDMASVYRERIDDDRLRAVTNFVRERLLGT